MSTKKPEQELYPGGDFSKPINRRVFGITWRYSLPSDLNRPTCNPIEIARQNRLEAERIARTKFVVTIVHREPGSDPAEIVKEADHEPAL